jgi:hypothetical protein
VKGEEQLRRSLGGAGKPCELLVTPDGSRLLLLLHGARVLGLFAPNSDENFYWTNPALSSSEPGELFRREGWHNSGGDRTWIAPEIDLHFPKLPDLTVYKVPGEVDPAAYQIERSGESLQFSTRVAVRSFRSHETNEATIIKSWGPASNPLRYEKVWSQLVGVQFAGYTQRTSIRLLGPGAGKAGSIGAWSLVQLPHGGTAFLPLHGATSPTTYVGSIAPEDIEVKDHTIRYKMQSAGVQKIGIRAANSTGRAGYVYSSEKNSVLVIRNVFINPSAEYVDAPWTDTGEVGERGYAFQFCNVNIAEVGTFSELEYHAPAVGRGTGQVGHDDVSQVWAFRGPEKLIRTIGKNLLSPYF